MHESIVSPGGQWRTPQVGVERPELKELSRVIIVFVACILVLWLMLPAGAQVVGLVLDKAGDRYCIARSNARPLNLYDIISIRRGGIELCQARVVQSGNVCMLRQLTPYEVQMGDQVVFVSAGPGPPATAKSKAALESILADYGPGPEIPARYLTTRVPPRSSSAKSRATFSGQGGGGG